MRRRNFVSLQGKHARHTDRTEVARREIEVDKLLLRLLAAEWREAEDRGMKALEIVKMMRDRRGKIVEAASKVVGGGAGRRWRRRSWRFGHRGWRVTSMSRVV